MNSLYNICRLWLWYVCDSQCRAGSAQLFPWRSAEPEWHHNARLHQCKKITAQAIGSLFGTTGLYLSSVFLYIIVNTLCCVERIRVNSCSSDLTRYYHFPYTLHFYQSAVCTPAHSPPTKHASSIFPPHWHLASLGVGGYITYRLHIIIGWCNPPSWKIQGWYQGQSDIVRCKPHPLPKFKTGFKVGATLAMWPPRPQKIQGWNQGRSDIGQCINAFRTYFVYNKVNIRYSIYHILKIR